MRMQAAWRFPLLPGPPSSQPGAPPPRITSFAFVLELDALCIANDAGGLVLLHLEGGLRAEEVGSIDGGVMALEWSPDGDTLALISGTGNLLVMNKVWAGVLTGGSPRAQWQARHSSYTHLAVA